MRDKHSRSRLVVDLACVARRVRSPEFEFVFIRGFDVIRFLTTSEKRIHRASPAYA